MLKDLTFIDKEYFVMFYTMRFQQIVFPFQKYKSLFQENNRLYSLHYSASLCSAGTSSFIFTAFVSADGNGILNEVSNATVCL